MARHIIEGVKFAGSPEPIMLGDYNVVVTIHKYHMDGEAVDDRIESWNFEIPISDLVSFVSSSVRVIEQVLERKIDDIAAGNCSQCENIRMVEQPRQGGYMETVHCPRCRPKIEKARKFIPRMPRRTEPKHRKPRRKGSTK